MADGRKNFLDTVEEQIAYRPLRKKLSQELEAHIQDRMEDYQEQGLPSEEAEAAAVKAMGDPVLIGTELNAVHQLQKAPALTVLTLVLFLSGLAASVGMRWSPEQSANGFLYYIPGAMVLLLMSWKGYPLVIRHIRWLLPLAGALFLAEQIFSIQRGGAFWQIGYFRYFALLLSGPFLILLAYRLRRHGGKTILTVMALCGICIFLPGFYGGNRDLSACAVLLASVAGALALMIHKDIFGTDISAHRRLYGITLAGLVFAACFLGSTDYRREMFQRFVDPDHNIDSTWDDTYNSALIRRLLSQTPLTKGIDLTPKERMDYGTGAWYFADKDPRQIGIYAIYDKEEEKDFEALVDKIRESGGQPRYIYFDESNVTLWDILPQHYHNNYRIAICILLFGWLAGAAYLAVIGGFYFMMFGCIRRIQGRLAFSLASCCGICLLAEGLFYILGNFGYQYASFTNLPLISEGRISIVVNMGLLGFIFSAYRYDHVEMEADPSFCRLSS